MKKFRNALAVLIGIILGGFLNSSMIPYLGILKEKRKRVRY